MPNISTFFGLETTLRALLAQQAALDTTGHNISNANTEGYTRQTAVLGASDALQVTDGTRQSTIASIGTGVQIQAYNRIRDDFLDLQYRAQNMVLGQQSATANSLDEVETALAEPGQNGIANLLTQFWKAWGDVANNPKPGSASRTALIEQTKTLTTSIQGLYSRLTQASSDAQGEYNSLIASPNGEVAQDAQELANLNQAIKRAVASGDTPNDLMDRRDVILDKLSGLGQVSITDLGNGSLNISFGDAASPLVADTTVNWPQSINNAGPPATSAGGQLGALYDLFKTGGTIGSLQTQLNGVAKDLADKVNALHNPGGSGTDFFSYTSGSEASTIAVNVSAAGVRTGTASSAEENDIARAIANLAGGTTDDLYATFVTRIGSMVQDAQRQQASSQALVDSVSARRTSTSGVSMDEEMTNMIKFQRAYQAAARAMSTMDDMLDIVINRTGRVGL
jgi:flagellar hook-associated protein 1 FlgK